jgi:hypothetical protein
MRAFWFKTLIPLILILSSIGSLNGQITLDGYSINPKLGIYNYVGGDTPSAVAGIEINAFKNHIIYAGDFYHYEEFVLFAYPSEEYNQIDFLIGKYIGDGFFRFQFQGGIGTFWGFKRGARIGSYFDHEKNNFFTLGIPLKLGIKLLPAKFISIGMDLQANLNFKKTTSMVLLSIEFGRLRNKID